LEGDTAFLGRVDVDDLEGVGEEVGEEVMREECRFTGGMLDDAPGGDECCFWLLPMILPPRGFLAGLSDPGRGGPGVAGITGLPTTDDAAAIAAGEKHAADGFRLLPPGLLAGAAASGRAGKSSYRR
jgi:hypothetical protein